MLERKSSEYEESLQQIDEKISKDVPKMISKT
jgi:hypothetical protein